MVSIAPRPERKAMRPCQQYQADNKMRTFMRERAWKREQRDAPHRAAQAAQQRIKDDDYRDAGDEARVVQVSRKLDRHCLLGLGRRRHHGSFDAVSRQCRGNEP